MLYNQAPRFRGLSLVERRSSRNFPRLLAAVVVAAVVIGAAPIASSYLGAARQTVAKTETEPNGSLLVSKTWGPWAFNVSINSTSVGVGGALLVSGELTYHGQAAIGEVEPVVGLGVYNSTGGSVWAFEPSQVTVEVTVTPGGTLGTDVCIPITAVALAPAAQGQGCEFVFNQQPLPGVYSIEAEPNFYSSAGNQDLGSNLQITANFTIF